MSGGPQQEGGRSYAEMILTATKKPVNSEGQGQCRRRRRRGMRLSGTTVRCHQENVLFGFFFACPTSLSVESRRSLGADNGGKATAKLFFLYFN